MPQYRKYKSDAEKAKVYEHYIKLAEQEQEKWHPAAIKNIRRYEALSRSEARSGSGHNVAGATPMVVGTIDALYSSMTAVDVTVTVEPRGRATEDQAYLAAAALEQEWERTKASERGNECIKDALLVGIGWVKVGYEYVEEVQRVPREEEDVRADVERLLREAEEAGNPISALDVMNSVPLEEDRAVVLSDRIVVDYVPWDMVLWDPTVRRWGDVRWVAQKQYMREWEIKNNPVFRAYAASRGQTKKLESLKPDSRIDRSILGTGTPTKEDERYTVYTIWDFETGTVCTWAKGTDFLLNETVNPFAINPDVEDKSPLVPLVLRHTPSRVRGISEMEVLAHIIEEKDLYHSRLATYLERLIPRVLAKAQTFTQAGKEALRSQEIGAVVEISETSSVDDIRELRPPTLMSELFQMPEKLEQAARDATGVSELMRGLFPDRRRTATETAEVVAASAARQAEKRTTLENFWLAIASRILQLMQMFYEQPRVARLADEAGDIPWEWSADDIVGQFELKVSLTPKEARSWQARRDDALAVLNTVGPLARPDATGASPVNVTELLRYVLSEMHIPRRVIRLLLNLPEQQQTQVLSALQQQAQAARAAAGIMPNPAGIPGPLDAQALAAAANLGTIPPEFLAGAGGATPVSPELVEQVSESAGVIAR